MQSQTWSSKGNVQASQNDLTTTNAKPPSNDVLDEPDLSHLTVEERRIIEEVMCRERDEERRNASVIKKSEPIIKRAQPSSNTIVNGTRKQTSGSLTNTLNNMVGGAIHAVGTVGEPASVGASEGGLWDTVCAICQKTKFVDGLGHSCVRCKRKFCTRCGYQFNSNSNDLQWICKPCSQTTPKPPSIVSQPNTESTLNAAGRLVSGLKDLFTETSSTRRRPTTVITNIPPVQSAPITKRRLPGPPLYYYQHQSWSESSPMHDPSDSAPNLIQSRGSFQELNPRISSGITSGRGRKPTPTTNNLRPYPPYQYYTDSMASEPSDSSRAPLDEWYPDYSPIASGSRSGSDYGRAPDGYQRRRRLPFIQNSHPIEYVTNSRGYENVTNRPRNFEPSSEAVSYPPYYSSSEGDEYFLHSDEMLDQSSDPTSWTKQPFSSHPVPQTSNRFEPTPRSIKERFGERRYYPDCHDYPQPMAIDDMHVGYASNRITQPVTWKPSKDRKRLIGHMILQKSSDPDTNDVGSIIGIKICGGKPNHLGHLGAFITHLLPGSLADSIGQLRVGDEILEWNGQSLRDLTANQVHEVIQRTKLDAHIELIAQRVPIGMDDEFTSHAFSADELRLHVPSKTSYRSADFPDYRPTDPCVQLKLFYENVRNQLNVCLMEARNLRPRTYPHNKQCNCYGRLRLLPGRDEMKYSEMISQTNHPQWNQAFKFVGYRVNELAQHDLEITLWDCDPVQNEQFLLGEVFLDLSMADLNDVPHWYPLQSENSAIYSSEAATPVVGSAPGFELETPDELRPTYSGFRNQDRSRTRLNPHSPIDSLRLPVRTRSDDYSDVDDQRYMSDTRLRRSLHSPGLNYGREDRIIHSDASEISDLSELSRMSLRTSPSEQTSQPFHSRLPEYPSSPYGPQSSGKSHNRRPMRNYSPRTSTSSTHYLETNSPNSKRSGDEQKSMARSYLGAPKLGDVRSNKESISSEGGSNSLAGNMSGDFNRSSNLANVDQSLAPSRGDGRKKRASIGHKFSSVLGRSNKNNPNAQLDKKSRTQFQRSEEVLPFDQRDMAMDSGEGTEGRDSDPGMLRRGILQTQSSVASLPFPPYMATDKQDSPNLSRNESHVGEFVEGLGPGQLVGRQVLGMPCLGEIQLSFYDRKGHLEVEVIRARGLQHKNMTKPIPSPYVKLHLLEGKQSVEKLRSAAPVRRTLDPLYQQQLTFSVPYHGKIIQVSVWGEYGRMEKKVFLGMCEVVLDDLDLTSIVFGWYKLFGMIASNAHNHHRHHRGTSASRPQTDDTTSTSQDRSIRRKLRRQSSDNPETSSDKGRKFGMIRQHTVGDRPTSTSTAKTTTITHQRTRPSGKHSMIL